MRLFLWVSRLRYVDAEVKSNGIVVITKGQVSRVI